jgi:replicative DNA helicase
VSLQDRSLDAAIDAERALLGALLLDASRFDDAHELLSAEDFYKPAHRLIFGAMVQLASEGRPVDPFTVQGVLSPAEVIEVGKPYLFSLTSGMPRGFHVREYATAVREYAIYRALEAHGREVIQQAQAAEMPAGELLATAESTIDRLRGRAVRLEVQTAEQRATAAYAHLEAIADGRGIQGTSTGLRDLDAELRGLHPGNLVLIGARTSQGKSCLALTMAMAAAETTKLPALFFSLEMSSDELNLRELTMRAQVDGWRLSHGRLHEAEYPRLADAIEAMRAGRVHMVDSPSLSVSQIRVLARRARANTGLSMIAVDYVQLVRDDRASGQTRTESLGEVTRGLKILARELQVPIVALSQLNRKVEERPDKRPLLHDLRESGNLEQDSDVVLLLYRGCTYFPDKPTEYPSDLAEIIIAKQRNGPTGVVTAKFIGEQSRFTDKGVE